jgi:hypothetical protein
MTQNTVENAPKLGRNTSAGWRFLIQRCRLGTQVCLYSVHDDHSVTMADFSKHEAAR